MTLLIDTPEKIKRTKNSITETKDKLFKELSYSKDLQIKDRIEFLNSHINRLENALENGCIETTF
jgi:beta-glucosidase/6-phospho-beta-glucosidase/beta-galactosidase